MGKEDIVQHQFKAGHKLATGRKKGSKNLKTLIKEALETKVMYKGKKVDTAFVVVSELINKAINNNNSKVQLEAIRELLDRSMGKPLQGNVNLNSDMLATQDVKDIMGKSFEVVANHED